LVEREVHGDDPGSDLGQSDVQHQAANTQDAPGGAALVDDVGVQGGGKPRSDRLSQLKDNHPG